MSFTKRPTYPVRLSQYPLKECLIDALFQAKADIDPNEKSKVRFPCPKCKKEQVTVSQSHFDIFGYETPCDPCVANRKNEINMELASKHWKNVCPKKYQRTDIDHEKFNVNAYNRARKISIDSGYKESIMLYGDTGSCKSRIACLMAYLALINGRKIGLFFPDDLKDRPRFQSRKEILVNLTAPDFIVLDDLFIAGAAKEDTADFIKDLLDRRYRNEKATVITSQSTAEDFAADANKFGTMSTTEYQRIKAIIRRVREDYTCIDCDNLNELETEAEGRF